MTPEERQMLAGLFDRVNAVGATSRDPQAEAFINDAIRAAPFAPYVLAQTVLVQQHAIEAASQRIAELEAAAAHAAQAPEQGGFLCNLSRSIFGGPPPAAQPPRAEQGYPQPGYAQQPPQGYPQQQPPQGYAPPPASGYAPQRPGPWGAPQGGAPQTGGGGGFLQNAASTAAGVAGGVVLGNMLGGLFGGHAGGGGLFGGGAQPAAGAETVNIFEQTPGKDDQGQFDPSMPDDAGFIDDSSFDDGSGGGGGFDDV
ncbi:hypothetical protein DFR50_14521 [Roseiarcus fermentans]|uniref:DUF2076 family protein n=1 Tax=Roseiarcus fermentans TaxID=1473586 RepID=A0A366ELM3_9HYPH|nr:DUF2076 domain-containing protein [Roseiarcus fermentans]RBP03268.1 hypothetical protein DFR50_14521 [Roseiarcus fermentans]